MSDSKFDLIIALFSRTIQPYQEELARAHLKSLGCPESCLALDTHALGYGNINKQKNGVFSIQAKYIKEIHKIISKNINLPSRRI